MYVIISINKTKEANTMNDITDLTSMTVRTVLFLVIAGVFYFVLKSKKKEK